MVVVCCLLVVVCGCCLLFVVVVVVVVGMCVCMEHLHRCKTSFGRYVVSIMPGAGASWQVTRQRRHVPSMVIPDLASLAYLHCGGYLLFRVCVHSIYFAIIAREWQPAKPRTGQKILCDYLFGPFGSVSKMVSDRHGFHNLFTGIFHHDSGHDLTYRFLN